MIPTVRLNDLLGDKLYYLASPYSKYETGIEMAFVTVCRVGAWLTKAGVGIYSPIAHTHPISKFGNIDPLAHDIWLPQDFKILTRCDALLVADMKGWDKSYGIGEEIKVMEKAGKPSYLLSLEGFGG
jgi:hypothetical protein